MPCNPARSDESRAKARCAGIAVDGNGQLYSRQADSRNQGYSVSTGDGPTSRPVHRLPWPVDGAVYAGEIGQIEIFEGTGQAAQHWRDEKLLGA